MPSHWHLTLGTLPRRAGRLRGSCTGRYGLEAGKIIELFGWNRDICKDRTKLRTEMAVCQNLVPLVNIKIAGKWMFIPLKMVLIGIDPSPDVKTDSINWSTCEIMGSSPAAECFFFRKQKLMESHAGRFYGLIEPPKIWREMGLAKWHTSQKLPPMTYSKIFYIMFWVSDYLEATKSWFYDNYW